MNINIDLEFLFNSSTDFPSFLTAFNIIVAVVVIIITTLIVCLGIISNEDPTNTRLSVQFRLLGGD